MKRAIKQPTKSQQCRHDRLREWGCICCHIEGFPGQPAEIHHINKCGRNISQDHVLPMCAYHHRGIHEGPMIGPSLAHGKKPFVAHYGSERRLMEIVDEAINERRAAKAGKYANGTRRR